MNFSFRNIDLKNADVIILMVISILFLSRLFHITDPPIEVAHNWRQTTSLMVARNFVQEDNNIFFPRIDDCGEKTGIVGMEFPLLSYAIYGVSAIVGYDHWYGRLINLIVVSFGIWFFYRLVGLYFNKKIALYAAVAFGFSALFHLARKVMPDPMALSLVMIGLYQGVRFLRSGEGKFLGGYFVFSMLGVLVKIPFGIYLSILIFPFLSSKIPVVRKFYFGALSAVILLAVYGWYFQWNTYLSEQYGLWYNSGRTFSEGWEELTTHPKETLEKFYFSAFHGFLFFAMSMMGLILAVVKKLKRTWWLIGMLTPLFVIYMLKSGYLFYHHGYYVLVMMPVLALCAGLFFYRLKRGIAIVVVLICVGESIANQQHDFFIKDKEYTKLYLEEVANKVSERTDRVALSGTQNPNEFYFLNRKGWLIERENISVDYLNEIKMQGCKYFFSRKSFFNENLPFKVVFENGDYIVWEL